MPLSFSTSNINETHTSNMNKGNQIDKNDTNLSNTISTQYIVKPGQSLSINENPSPYHTLSLYSGILNHFNIYNHWIINKTLNLGIILHRHLDRGLIELIGPTGLINLIHYIGFR